MIVRAFAVYRPGFPATCFGPRLGVVLAPNVAAARRAAARLFGPDIIVIRDGGQCVASAKARKAPWRRRSDG
jgi:hypothetical protein